MGKIGQIAIHQISTSNYTPFLLPLISVPCYQFYDICLYMKTYLPLIGHNPYISKYAPGGGGGDVQMLNFQNTFLRTCDEI